MKAEDYLTQEMIDKLQADVDDNNGVIDWDDLEPLLDGFKEQLLISGVVKSLPTQKEIDLKAEERAIEYNYINEIGFIRHKTSFQLGALFVKEHLEKQK